ncbi:MAG: alginate export family protein, partial [Proteobacteria bacterium]|nr:alginate export family protein [Pseudomonadota bacterium]
MTNTRTNIRSGSILLLAAAGLSGVAMAADSAPATPATPATFVDAMTGGKAHLEFRYRLETVDQDPFTDDAVASTLRSRLNYQTGEWNHLTAFLEADNVTVLGNDTYNSTVNGVTDRPVVADPEYTEANQVYLQLKLGTFTGIGGRQRITLDNQRFIGNVGWRQNEQTYDALTFKSSALTKTQLHYSYIANVNRITGPDEGSQPANYHGASHALNGKVDLGAFGAVTGFAYLLDFQNAPALSSSTYGVHWAGTYKVAEATKLNWLASYASQGDYADNRNDYSADYYLLEGGATLGKFGLKAGYEVLGGDDQPNHAFQTPLATLHAFQGWADKFLTTPRGGVEDLYLGATANVGPVALQLVWH